MFRFMTISLICSHVYIKCKEEINYQQSLKKYEIEYIATANLFKKEVSYLEK